LKYFVIVQTFDHTYTFMTAMTCTHDYLHSSGPFIRYFEVTPKQLIQKLAYIYDNKWVVWRNL